MTQSKLPTLLLPSFFYTQSFLEEDLGERQRESKHNIDSLGP